MPNIYRVLLAAGGPDIENDSECEGIRVQPSAFTPALIDNTSDRSINQLINNRQKAELTP